MRMESGSLDGRNYHDDLYHDSDDDDDVGNNDDDVWCFCRGEDF